MSATNPSENQPDVTPRSMPFGEHLEELRRHLVFAVAGLIPILVLALYFGPTLLEYIIRPVQEKLRAAGQTPTLQSTGPLETFTTYIHVSVIAALIVGGPWILWNLWRFVAPGLYRSERRYVYFLLPLSVLLTTVGTAFLYTVVLPITLFFLISFGSSVGTRPITIDPNAPSDIPVFPVLNGDPKDPAVNSVWINRESMQIRVLVEDGAKGRVIWSSPLNVSAGIEQNYRVAEYVKLFLAMALAFALAFQLPVVVLLLGWVGIIDNEFLSKHRRHAVMACAVIAALLTPGDPTQMLLLGFPLWGLYELGGLLLRVVPASRVRGRRGNQETEENPERVRRAPIKGLGKAARAVLPPREREPADAGDE